MSADVLLQWTPDDLSNSISDQSSTPIPASSPLPNPPPTLFGFSLTYALSWSPSPPVQARSTMDGGVPEVSLHFGDDSSVGSLTDGATSSLNASLNASLNGSINGSLPEFNEPGGSNGSVNDPLDTHVSRLHSHLTVDTPQKVMEGTAAFVTYLVTSRGTEDQLPERVRRRFSEFVKLYKQLVAEYPACAVPPLPDRSRFEYIAGDRFSPEFTSKRAASLERFLFRVTQHPELGRSRALAAFLAPRDMTRPAGAGGSSGSSGNGSRASALDQISDSLINAFVKVKYQSKEMVDARERADRFEHNVCTVDRAVLRVARNQQDLATDFEEIRKQAIRLAKVEPGLGSEFGHLAATAKSLNEATQQLRVGIDSQFAGALRDMSHYVQALKGMLKQREQRQIDYEALVEYLTRTEAELAAVHQGSGGTASASSYLRGKVNDLRGVDKEQARAQRAQKLKVRTAELRTEVDKAKKVSDQFEDLAKREVKVFERIEEMELQTCLGGLADSYIDYFQRVLRDCRAIEEQL